MKRSYLIAGVLAAAVAAWIGSGLLGSDDNGGIPVAAGPEAATPTPRVRVKTSTAEESHVRLSLFGRTEAGRKTVVRAETAGRIDGLPVAKGARVKAGEILARLAMDDRQARVEQARALADQRRIEHEAAKELAEKSFRSRTKLAEAVANLEAAQAVLDAARLDVRRTAIAAPYAGVLDERPVELGDFVAIGGAVGTVVDLDPLRVVVEVSERHALHVGPGSTAVAHFADGRVATGTVVYVATQADPATRTFRVEVKVPNPEGEIPEGLTAEVRLDLLRVRAHRISPAALTLDDAGRVGVKAVDAEGRAVFHAAEVVDDDQEGMWLGGLPDRLDLIVVGQEYVVAGQKVEAVPVEAVR